MSRAAEGSAVPGVGLRAPAGPVECLARPGCHVVQGDLDYVASQRIIRDCFDYEWSDWERKIRGALTAARQQPATICSLYGRTRKLREAEILARLATIANEYADVAALFHFFDAEGMTRALEIYQGRALINYVSGEAWSLAKVLPLLQRTPACVVAQPLDAGGIPSTAAARAAIAVRIADALAPAGLTRADIYVDPLTPADGMLPFPLDVSVETIARVKELGFRTVLWPANAGLGHADPEAVAANYAAKAARAGLDLAIVTSTDKKLRAAIADATRIAPSLQIAPASPA